MTNPRTVLMMSTNSVVEIADGATATTKARTKTPVLT